MIFMIIDRQKGHDKKPARSPFREIKSQIARLIQIDKQFLYSNFEIRVAGKSERGAFAFCEKFNAAAGDHGSVVECE